MSQFCSSCKLRISICCILLSQFLVLTEASRMGIRSSALCSSLYVGHGEDAPLVKSSTITVTVSLVDSKTKERSFCYRANTNYLINMNTSMDITGLLMVQDNKHGIFPNPNASLPSNLAFGLCTTQSSVTHNCRRETPCNFGKSLDLPYTAPENESNILQFRYSVVFDYKLFHQNVMVHFHPCTEKPTSSINTMQPPATTPSNSIHTCNASEYILQESPTRANNTCRNSPKILIRHHILTDNSIDYNCTIDNGQSIRKKMCGSGCRDNDNGELLCCRVRHRSMRMRSWTCTALSDNVPEDKQKIHRTFALLQTRKCECFHCKDVCPTDPTETATEFEDSSNDVDTSISDSSEETDRNMLDII